MKEVNELFFQLFTERNSDQTKNLRLRGSELFQRIGKRLEASDMYQLVDYLDSEPNVQFVDLSYNNIGDDGLKILTENFFDTGKHIQELNLLHCDITPKGLQILANCTKLRFIKLRLSGNKLGPEGAIHIETLVENCDTLECLDINETDQTVESIEYLLMIFENRNLKVIDVSRIAQKSFYSYYDESLLADCLSVYLKLNQTLTELHLEKCEFDGHDVEMLLIGLRVHPNLLMLNLTANKIGNFGTELLAKWLKTRPALIGLRLSANSISLVGALALSLCLPYSRIRHLDLQKNQITDEGLANLLNTIKKPTAMRHLYMWGNEIGFMTLERIERMLQSSVLKQDHIDVRVYYVDGVRYPAHYQTDAFKHNFYLTRDYGFPPELKIKKNMAVTEYSKPRALVGLSWINRYPPVKSNAVDLPKKKKCPDAKGLPTSKKMPS